VVELQLVLQLAAVVVVMEIRQVLPVDQVVVAVHLEQVEQNDRSRFRR
jgi:hypothetical protein